MFIEIDLAQAKPIYEQLLWEVKRVIANGELQPGEELPSVRELSSDLGINLHTVNKTYKLLADEGILIRQRNRFVVNQPADYRSISKNEQTFQELMRHVMIEEKLLRLTNLEKKNYRNEAYQKIYGHQESGEVL